MGVPAVVIADDPHLLDTAAAAYADWKATDALDEPVIRIRLERGGMSSRGVSGAITVKGSRLTISGDGIAGSADAAYGLGHAVVPDRLAGDGAALAGELLDTVLLFLLTRSGRTPIHAAGVRLDGRLLILAGASGSGKSTLAHAAARAGWAVFSDDTVYVEQGPPLRVWGMRRPIHLLPQDAPAGCHPMRLRGGRFKAAIAVAMPDRLVADRSALVLLERGTGVALAPVRPDDATAALSRLEPGFDLLREDSGAAVAALAAQGAWRLTLSRDPDAAIALLADRLGG